MIFFLNESLRSPLQIKHKKTYLNVLLFALGSPEYPEKVKMSKKSPKSRKQTKYLHRVPPVCLFSMKIKKINFLNNFEHFTYPDHFRTTSGSKFMATLSYSTFFTGMVSTINRFSVKYFVSHQLNHKIILFQPML